MNYSKMTFSQLMKQICFVFMLSLAACKSDSVTPFQSKPNTIPNVNKILVVADNKLWNTPVGVSFDFHYGSAFPVLPQPEPIFDIEQIEAKELFGVKKQLRNIVLLANINEDSPTSQLIKNALGEEKTTEALKTGVCPPLIQKNRWANGQYVYSIYGNSDDNLIKNIEEYFPKVSTQMRKVDDITLKADTYQSGINASVNSTIKALLGVKIEIPNDYRLAVQEQNMVWLRKETDVLSSNILIHSFPYKNKKQLSNESLKAVQDSLSKKYIASEVEGSYKKIADSFIPTQYKTRNLNGYYSLEARGLWELEVDYMGGPFISYLIHNPDTNKLVFIEGFVYAAGEDKREFMQHLEIILESISL